jgi:DNA-binding SARP family transcriptional activator
VEVAVLGPVEVVLNGEPVDLGTPKQRALVSALALSRGWPVSVDAIVDLLWDQSPPPGVTATLQAYVSQLRRVLEPDRQRRAPATVLVTVAPGYALRVPDEAIDAHRFEQAVGAEHRRLQPLAARGPSPLTAAELTEACTRLDAALDLWRGTPYAELGDADAAVAERVRLEELRTVALEDRATAQLALGHHATVVAELEALTKAYPLRERLWALRAVALTRSGRQADALDVLRQLREVLDEELGLEPSAELRDLQTAVLRQDPALDWVPPKAGDTPAAAHPVPQEAAGGARPLPEPVAPWPVSGRDEELAELEQALAGAEAGTPSYAVLTGEPGIGKTRLAAELALRARDRGARVLLGRCSQDDGAPPLWPWRAVLGGLGVDSVEEEGDEDGGAQFRAWERIVQTLLAASRERTTMVVLDDLHWADPSTLRVLRLLVESAGVAGPDAGERLLVLATWRPHPEPTGVLADVAESFARRHAVRIALTGLPAPAVAELLEQVSRTTISEEVARQLRERTDGNPFFLVEFARLAGERADPEQLAASMPTAVTEVLSRRLTRLSDATVRALRVAAVIGRQFDTPTLAGATGIDEDDLLDVVEPAQAAGLVREDGIDRFLFSHALVRDTLRGQMSASRQARAHARVAAVLEQIGGRETEVARHWLESGPSYAPKAWRAATAAAALARRLHAYDEAAELLERAVTATEEDPEATPAARYDLLLRLMDAYRWAARLPPLVGTVERAVAVGKQMRDPEAVARAAIATSRDGLWRSAPPGQVNDVVVSALRGSLERLPAEDGELRCLTMLALANELWLDTSYQERRALCDEALAMARRIADPGLLLDACQMAFVGLWHAENTAERLALATEAQGLARDLGEEQAFVVSATLRTVALCELGRRAEMLEQAEVARQAAQRLRISYAELVLDGLEVPWQALAGRFDECERLADNIRDVAGRISHDHGEETIAAVLIAVRLWDGHALEAVPALEELKDAYDMWATLAVHRWRGGDRDGARALHAERRDDLDPGGHAAPLSWGHSAELALYLDDAEMGGRCYDLLAPCAGQSCGAGSNLASGPVDAYLAMAAAAAGETAIATRHAGDAAALAEEWDIPLFGRWFAGLREQRGF